MLAIGAKATEHILHRQGIGRMKHIDVAYLWMQDEIGSKRFRVRRVKSEENAADLRTKPLSKSSSCETLPHSGIYINMAEESVKCKRQDVAMCWDIGSMQIGRMPRGKIQMFVTGDRTVSLQNFMTGDRQPAWRSQLVTMSRKAHMRSTPAAATNTVAQFVAFKVSDRDRQRLHQRSRVASSDREFE